MQLSRAPKTSDHFGRYYTDQDIAGLLVKTVCVKKPGIVIDLGAGDGALAGEASMHWDEARFVTVDIDCNAGSSRLNDLRGSAFTHHVGNALDDSLDQKIGLAYGSVDLALCNPPYVRPKWRKHFGEILEDAGLSHIIPKFGCITAEVLFIAQNLRFLRAGGKLGLILPDGVIAGEKFAKLRHSLATAHRLERVIELPRRVFHNTDAKAHIVVLAKHESAAETIRIQRLEASGMLSPAIDLNTEKAIARLDYSYLASHQRIAPKARGVRLRDIMQVLTRGSYSSAERKECSFPVFHTTDFEPGSLDVPRDFVLSKSAAASTCGIVAQAGDILIARVGRNLEQKVCTVTRGAVAISDCVMLLRVAPRYHDRAVRFLSSASGRAVLLSISHGVGARFITTEAMLELVI